MSSIRAQLAAHGLERIADQIEAAAKPSLLLVSGEESTAPVSRLGGEPNLPEHIEWPTWRGRSLPFIAQLDLATLPPVHGLMLPASGSLYFFYEGGEAWGYQIEDRGSAQVLYLPTAVTVHTPRPLPTDVPGRMRFRSVPLEFAFAQLSVPDCDDQFLDGLALSAEERSRYFDFFIARADRGAQMYHRVGGYPDQTQGDPKLEAQLVTHGLFCGDSTGYDRGRELGLWPGALDWEVLLQVDSDDRADMMWGDVGRIYFLIRWQDLALRAFDKTWLVFQCL